MSLFVCTARDTSFWLLVVRSQFSSHIQSYLCAMWMHMYNCKSQLGPYLTIFHASYNSTKLQLVPI